MSNTNTHPLLVPRIRVKADYPNSPYAVGQILNSILDIRGDYMVKVDDYGGYGISWFLNYPHLFELLPWWAERSVEEMPDYVKWSKTGAVSKCTWDVLGLQIVCVINGTKWPSLNTFLPASQCDYDNYIKSKI